MCVLLEISRKLGKSSELKSEPFCAGGIIYFPAFSAPLGKLVPFPTRCFLGNCCRFNNVLMFSEYSSNPSMGPLELHLKIQKTDLTETLMEFYQCRLNEM